MEENRILSGRELMSIQFQPDNYIIEALLWERQIIGLVAKEKVGKSILSLQMACCLSCGENFLGEYEIPNPMNVLYIQTESTRHETIERLRAMTHESGVAWNEDNFYLMHTESLSLDKDSGIIWLINEIKKKNIEPQVVVIDPLYMCMEGSLSDELPSRSAAKNLRIMSAEFDCAIILVQHEHRPRTNPKTGKTVEEGDNAIMGSFVWKAFTNHTIRLVVLPDKTRLLSCGTQRSSRVIDKMKLELKAPLPLMYTILDSPDCPSYVSRVLQHITKNGPKSAGEVHEETGLSLSAVKKSLGYLSKHNVNSLYKLNPGHRPTMYAVVTPPSSKGAHQQLPGL